MTSSLWSPLFRASCFVIILILVVLGLSRAGSILSLDELTTAAPQIMRFDFSAVQRKEFAYALAALLFETGMGFLAAFLLLHVIAICRTLGSLRKTIAHAPDSLAFAKDFHTIDQHLSANPFIGPAWRVFSGTLILPDADCDAVRTTIRPQSFLNLNAARERLAGLKFMSSIPGYYVGIGLLLTFIGLVLALDHAAQAVSSDSAEGMQGATRGLLQVATFKFATSIAGLGMSIVLSIFFRVYQIVIESSFDKFNHALETCLVYATPQRIALESKQLMQEQAHELKAINSEQFFSRLGEQVSPHIERAMADAVRPMNDRFGAAVERMAETSQTGVANLIDRFSASVQGGAGQELRALAVTLGQLDDTLRQAQHGISGSGEDFGRRMSEAAEKLSRLVDQAAGRLGEGSEKSQAALEEIVEALRATFRKTNAQVQQATTQAAEAAAAQLQTSMSEVFRKVDEQLGAFRASVGDFEKGLGAQFEEAKRGAADAQAASVKAVAGVTAVAAKALEEGLAEALARVRQEVGAFVEALAQSQAALAAQAASVQDAAGKSRSVADAFHATAADLRVAAAPLLQSGDRVAHATGQLEASVKQSVDTLTESQKSSSALAEAIAGHQRALAQSWSSYEEKFRGVDRDLAAAFGKLAEENAKLGDVLTGHVARVDSGMAKTVDRLAGVVGSFQQNVEDLAEAVENLVGANRRAAE